MNSTDLSPELKRALRTSLSIPKFHVPEHSLTARAHEKIRQFWCDPKPKEPASFDLGKIHERVVAQWRTTNSLDQLRIKDRRWIPWILFYPPNQKHEWLGSNEAFSSKFSGWLRKGTRASAIISLIKVLLLRFDPENVGFRRWLTTARAIVENSKSPRISKWAERCTRFGLLERNGPEEFARHIRQAGRKFAEIEEEAGFVGELAQSEFLCWVCDALSKSVSADLKREQLEGPELSSLLSFFQSDSKKLRFESRRKTIADALLLPFTNSDPPDGIREPLKKFFITFYGDPRIWPWRLWDQVDERARGVLIRWLVTATLEDFFRVIGGSALESHWQYREAFWRAYLNEGVIEEAWVVLGDRVSRSAISMLKGAGGGYARLTGGVQREQSVLIMRIGNLIFAEWSHNGTCRAWLVDDKKAPKMYKQSYHRSDLVWDPRFAQEHRGSDRGSWQQKVADFIREHTGIRMLRPSYMP